MFIERDVNNHKKVGTIEVVAGSMFSGKTEELIRRLKRAKIARPKSRNLQTLNGCALLGNRSGFTR